MTRPRRFFLYCQHLSGTGHFVRTFEIARALAEVHDVVLLDGGRHVPRTPAGPGLRMLPLPRLVRAGGTLRPLEADRSVDDVFVERHEKLLAAIAAVRPDALMIEHFPFSKWELEREIVPLIERAREVNPQIKVICSLRDIAPRTRNEPAERDHRSRVLDALRRWFDRLLVHADPRLVRLESHVPWAGEIPVPIDYTGYVSERPAGAEPPPAGGERAEPGPVLVSAGGTGAEKLRALAIESWQRLTRDGITGGRSLFVFLPLVTAPGEVAALEQAARGIPVFFRPFCADFLDWLSGADLSISQAGYNSCANVLETRTRAILVPNPDMSDQPFRARLLAERGLATSFDSAGLTCARLTAAIAAALEAPRPQHDIDLEGAQKTRAILESLTESPESCASAG